MAKLNEMFPSNYLKAADIEDDTVVCIASVQQEQIGEDDKYVLYFEELEKGLVLNKTNAESISQVLNSDDTDDWPGQQITLFTTTVTFNGKPTEAIRVKLRKPKPHGKPVQQPQRQSRQVQPQDDESDVPF